MARNEGILFLMIFCDHCTVKEEGDDLKRMMNKIDLN
jgi:hypothetical protein